jgi:hypothetical protein
MYFQGHFLNVCVTHDLGAALEGIDAHFGKIDWIVIQPVRNMAGHLSPQAGRA